jgi:hypothetical protein
VDGDVQQVLAAGRAEPPVAPILGLVEVDQPGLRIETVRDDIAGAVERRIVAMVA